MVTGERVVLTSEIAGALPWHPLLAAVFGAMTRDGVIWCLLRMPDNPLAPGGDIDLLIAPGSLRQATAILCMSGFVRVPGRAYGIHYLTYHGPTDQWLWLHLVTELSFGQEFALRSQLETTCLARREPRHGAYVLAVQDALWALLLHALLDKGQLAPRDRARLAAMTDGADADGPLARKLGEICPPGWSPDRVLASVAKGEWATLEALAPTLHAAWLAHCRDCRARLRVRRALAPIRRWASVPQRRGLTVALLAPDGAGKSTLAAGLVRTFVFPTTSLYMGLTGGLLPRAARLRLFPLIVLARVLILWLRYLRGNYLKWRGRLVVFDRYIYDYIAPPPTPLTEAARVARWIEGHACPAPDLVIFLNAPGSVMYARKSEYSAEVLDDWRQKMLTLQGRLPHLTVIDTSVDTDQVRTAATERIWQCYAARWSGIREERAVRNTAAPAGSRQNGKHR